MSASPYRTAPARLAPRPPPERTEHKAWWCHGPVVAGWVPFQTYRWTGCWYVPETPWVLVEERP